MAAAESLEIVPYDDTDPENSDSDVPQDAVQPNYKLLHLGINEHDIQMMQFNNHLRYLDKDNHIEPGMCWRVYCEVFERAWWDDAIDWKRDADRAAKKIFRELVKEANKRPVGERKVVVCVNYSQYCMGC